MRIGISVDIDAVRTQMMDGDSIAALEDALREIQVKIPYIKVEKSDVFEKKQDEHLASLRRAFESERRTVFADEVNKVLGRHKRMTHETKEQFERRVLGQSKASMMEDFDIDAEEAFRSLIGDYDQGMLWSKAQDRLNRNQQKIVDRVNARGGAFVHANAAIKEIKEIEESKAQDEEALREWKTRSTFRYRAVDKLKFAGFK